MAVALVSMICILGACAVTPPDAPVLDRPTAQRNVYIAWESYGIAERLATGYASLKRCPAPAPCSEQGVIDQMVKARNAAREALNAAQSAVDNPAFGVDQFSTAAIAAQSGLSAFLAFTNKYGVK